METLSERDFDNSRTLDVHRWSEYPEVNSFVNAIYAEHFASSFTEEEEQKLDPEIQKKHVKVVLLDLYVCWLNDPTMCIAVGMGRNLYKAKGRYNSLHISSKTIFVVDRLKEIGLIDLKAGFYDRREGGHSRVTRIWPTDKLIEEFRKAKFSPFEIAYHADRETIILKDENKKRVEYDETDETVRMRKVLTDYNRLLADAHIDCAHLDQPYVLGKKNKQTGKMTRIGIGADRKFVYRVFNNGSFTQGGRFYGGWWERIKKEHRLNIRINGERVIELDYSGMHAGLLYAEKGINFWNIGRDPYNIDVEELDDYPEAKRATVKTLMMVAINAGPGSDPLKAARRDIAAAAKGDEDSEGFEFPEGFKLTDKFLDGVLANIKEAHPLIAARLGSGAGVDLQFVDSQIAEKLIEKYTKKGVPILTVHDSFVVPEKYNDSVRYDMLEEWAIATKLKLGPEVNPFGDLHDLTDVKQHGYLDELQWDDPEGHEEMLRIKASEYVSDRYTKSLKAHREWLVGRKY